MFAFFSSSDYEDEPSTSGIMSAMSTASLPVTGGVVANRFFGQDFSIDRSKLFVCLEQRKRTVCCNEFSFVFVFCFPHTLSKSV